jgi:hypothetical protein
MDELLNYRIAELLNCRRLEVAVNNGEILAPL